MGSTVSSLSRDLALPDDVLVRVASFLLGVDVINLARASPASRAMLEGRAVWAGRVEPNLLEPSSPSEAKPHAPAWCCLVKFTYLQPRSMAFRGARGARRWLSPQRDCGDFVRLPGVYTSRDPHFSVELTFSVPPVAPSASACQGGVLIGFQDWVCSDAVPPGPLNAVPLAAVDSRGSLHISQEPTKYWSYPVAQLAFGRWHHLLVVFDGLAVRAFLDGELRVSMYMTRAHQLSFPRHGQLGTGFRQKPRSDVPSDKSPGWDPFHGIVADARVVYVSLSAADALRRAQGERRDDVEFMDLLDGDFDGHVERVVTSRPCERHAQMLLRS